MYPPRSIQVFIGNDQENFHYSSQEFNVLISEKYCTIQILPEIVIGKYVKIDFIGKITCMPNTNLYIVAIEFLDIIGCSLEEHPDTNLERAIKTKEIPVVLEILNRNHSKSTPFIMDLMENFGISEKVLQGLTRNYNEVESFVLIKKNLKFPININRIKSSEALGDLCFESGAFLQAFYHYSRISDI